MSKDDYARAIIAEGQRRGITPRGIVIALATGLVESNIQNYANSKVPESLALPHDAVGSDGYSVGIFQQQVRQGSNGQWWWGDARTCMDPTLSAGLFYDRLAKLNYNGPNSPGSYAQAVQQSAYPDRYDQRMGEAQSYYDRLVGQPNGGNAVGFTGDPVWLEDVLREALGDRLVVEGDWRNVGNGDTMGNIWGVMIHHTGNSNERVAVIRDGRPDLSGPLSNGLITPDGKFHLVAVGPCNHAGVGSYPGIPTNNANHVLLGFECAWPDIAPDGSYNAAQRWPDAQIVTMRDAAAAVIKKLGYGQDRVIGHKEYAGAAQGKWDPGNIDMNWFRGEVGKDLRGEFDGAAPKPVPVPPGPLLPPDYAKETWDQLRLEWPQLGGQTVVNALAEVRDKVCGTTDKDKR